MVLDHFAAARLAAAEAEIASTASALGLAESTRLGQARAVLEALAVLPGVVAGGAACYGALEAVDASSDHYAGLAVVRPDGAVLCASTTNLQRVHLGDRAYFRRAVSTGRFVVSDLVVARGSEGVQVIVAALPVLAIDGRVIAVLVAGLPLDWVGDLTPGLAHRGGVDMAMILDGEGRVITRSPPDQNLVGRTFGHHPFAAALLTQGQGVVRTETLDGVRRLVGFTRLPDSDAILVVGRDEASVLAPIQAEALVAYGALLLSAALAGILATWFGRAVLLRGIDSVARAAREGRRMAEVSLDARTPPEVVALHAALSTSEGRLFDALAEVERRAATDPLTGLANRRTFGSSLEQAWRGAARNEEPLSLLSLDADRFKLFNDRYGHPAGDHCLQMIATVLENVARRAYDLPARVGGEEFAILLPNTDREGALHVAERLRQLVEQSALPHVSNEGGVVTVSIGIATAYPTSDSGPSLLSDRADAALYRAKRSGRNQVAAADEEDACEMARTSAMAEG